MALVARQGRAVPGLSRHDEGALERVLLPPRLRGVGTVRTKVLPRLTVPTPDFKGTMTLELAEVRTWATMPQWRVAQNVGYASDLHGHSRPARTETVALRELEAGDRIARSVPKRYRRGYYRPKTLTL